jgi:SpoVK/Ycf46/Vps4 family AAA+-type ATPase
MVTNFKNVDQADFIDGKTGGLVILLYGSPGVGKTFTAEATAEILHQPLCKISVGSLGTTPETVERGLQQFFSDVKRWNGIALIDEIDIFLEKRSSVKTDITKNAIVGVFLKILEYCDAIVFMTSNRIESIDPAMESRIDLKLEYDELSIEDKIKIYCNKMKKIKVVESHEEIRRFMEKYYHLNGRNLKSIIKTAQRIAFPHPPTLDHMSAVVELIDC